MGVTIHFEGKLRDSDSLQQVISFATEFAERFDWPWQKLNEQNVKLKRVRNEQDWDYEGPVEGLVIYPHNDCDPLRLEFDQDFYIQEYCKTQFAGREFHVRIVELLRDISKYFSFLDVFDESEFWETGDVDVLDRHLSNFYLALNDELKKYPNAKIKVKLPSGRIIDLMT